MLYSSDKNCNRLVRQFYPKGTNFTNISDKNVRTVEDIINDRKRQGLLSPIQIFNQKIAFIN